jgi:hypothetical protein
MRGLISQRLDHSISLPSSFFILNLSFHILGTLVGSKSFIELFVAKVLHEDLGMISNLPMFTNFKTTFTILSLCYA